MDYYIEDVPAASDYYELTDMEIRQNPDKTLEAIVKSGYKGSLYLNMIVVYYHEGNVVAFDLVEAGGRMEDY